MFNQTTIMGFLGNDPAIHTFQSGAGSKSATFTVAVNKSYIDRQGHKQTITTWFSCVAYNKMADIVAQIAKKGSLVFIQGEMQQNKPYTNKDGVQVQSYSLVVDTIRLCGGSSNSELASPTSGVTGGKASEAHYDASSSQPYNQNGTHRTSEAASQSGKGKLQHQPPVVEDIDPNDIPF